MKISTKVKPLVWLFIVNLLLANTSTYAANDRVHILIPGGAGGGWDTTARGIGDVLARSGLLKSASFENMSGGGGSKAIAYLIETAERQHNTLMVSSTPILLNALKGTFPQTYKDLVPIATAIADYGAFVVRVDSRFHNWEQVVEAFKHDPRDVKVAGGSIQGSMDHLVAALAIKKSGLDARQLRYIPYNAGAKAMVGLLSGETQMLSTGLSEAISLAEQGEVRILAMTASKRLDFSPNVPTLVEQGVAMNFTNWRGFFAAPGFPVEQQAYYQKLLGEMYQCAEWDEMRQSRGWTNLFISGVDFIHFLQEQEKTLNEVMIELDMK